MARCIDRNRNGNITADQCAECVEYQLPTEYTRVICLLASINSMDNSLLEDITMVRKDEDHVINKLEAKLVHLLPHYYVASRKNTSGEDYGVILSDTEDKTSSISVSSKSSVGKNGVEFHYCKEVKFKNLSDSQKQELRQHRCKNRGAQMKIRTRKRSRKIGITMMQIRK